MKTYSKALRKRVTKIFEIVRDKYDLQDTLKWKDFDRICISEEIFRINPEFADANWFRDNGTAGFFYRADNPKWKKVVWVDVKAQHSIFAAGHELGHFFLSHIRGASFRQYRPWAKRSIYELEADYFAELITGIKRGDFAEANQ